jgi:Lon protease-like protein
VTGLERVLPLFPLEQVVLFPGMPLPLRVFEERYKVMIGECQVTDQLFGVLLIRSGHEVGAPAEPERIGCTTRMQRVERMPDGQMFILTSGEQRFRLLGPARAMPEGYLVGDVEILTDAATAKVEPELVASVVAEFEKYRAAAVARMRHEERAPPAVPREPAALSYRVGATLQLRPRELQQLLELDDVTARLQHELVLLKRENRFAAKSIGPFSMN